MSDIRALTSTFFQGAFDIVPVPKARARVVGRTAFTPERTRDYERDLALLVKAHARKNRHPIPFTDDLAVWLTFRVGASARGDIDNYAKGVLDALNNVIWWDDRQVVELHTSLDRVNEPIGVSIMVHEAGI